MKDFINDKGYLEIFILNEQGRTQLRMNANAMNADLRQQTKLASQNRVNVCSRLKSQVI